MAQLRHLSMYETGRSSPSDSSAPLNIESVSAFHDESIRLTAPDPLHSPLKRETRWPCKRGGEALGVLSLARRRRLRIVTWTRVLTRQLSPKEAKQQPVPVSHQYCRCWGSTLTTQSPARTAMLCRVSRASVTNKPGSIVIMDPRMDATWRAGRRGPEMVTASRGLSSRVKKWSVT